MLAYLRGYGASCDAHHLTGPGSYGGAGGAGDSGGASLRAGISSGEGVHTAWTGRGIMTV